MSTFNEHTLETAILDLMKRQGYKPVPASDITRRSNDEVILHDDLSKYLSIRYKEHNLNNTEIETIISHISANAGNSLYENNVHTLRLITDGFTFQRQDHSKPNIYINPVDFGHVDSNIFKIVTQLEIEGYHKRIPDAIVYVNGLPLVVMEFKSTVKENTTINDAYIQLTVRYRRDIPDLFKYNAFVVISDGINNKYGTLYSPYDFFYTWPKINSQEKTESGIKSLETMVGGLFRIDRLLNVIKNYIYLPDSSTVDKKIICRYPQYFATEKLYANILAHSRISGGDGKGGTYFGATGCGKSFTMLFLARRLMRSQELHSPTIVIITDRTDLDEQLSGEFTSAHHFLSDNTVVEVESRENLRALLKDKESGGIFLTTIQKFSADTKLLSDRANIICISDEAHRSQVNLSQKVTKTDNGVKRSYGFAKHLRTSFPNATYCGFTGTPIDATLDVFGPVVDSYTMTESVADGITRRIVYEGRAAKVYLDGAKMQKIEDLYTQLESQGANEYQLEASKRQEAQMERILANHERISAIASDLISHYENRIAEASTVKGKAMIVCYNRRIAWQLYKELVRQRPDWISKRTQGILNGDSQETIASEAGENARRAAEKEAQFVIDNEKIRLVMTQGKNDEPALCKILGDDNYRKSLDTLFKNPDSKFKIAIVVDMWITGFDVPCLDTMYIDKPLQQHTLIQTISRVNRVYEGKDKGLIVDYIGLKSNMNAALKRYAECGDNADTIEAIEQSIAMVQDELDIIRRLFVGFDYGKFTTGTPLEQLECLNLGAEHIQQTHERQTMFMGHTRKRKTAFNLCTNSDRISTQDREDIHYFSGIRSIIFKLTQTGIPDITQISKRVSAMVEEAIKSQGVEEIVNISDKSNNLDLLSNEYMERLEKLQLPNTKVKLMERLLRQVISDFSKVNKTKGIDFTQRLNSLVLRYNDRRDSATYANEVLDDVATQMATLIKEIQKEKSTFQDLGISYEEKAFYDILVKVAKNYNFYDEYLAKYGEDTLRKMAISVKAMVDDKSKYTDWLNRQDIKDELKMDLILILAEYHYPPVTNDEVFKEIFEQAENFRKYNG